MEILQTAQGDPHKTTQLYKAAQALEAEFIKTMLKESGFGEINDSFSSSDQNQWLSFLHDAVAQKIVEQKSMGLAEILSNELKGDK